MTSRRDPAFSLALAALFALLFVLLYGGANLLAALVPWRIRPALPFEAAIPFVPAWSAVYLSLPLLLLLCGLRLDRRGAWTLFAVLAAELAAAAPFFVLLPVQTAWPPREAGAFGSPFSFWPTASACRATTSPPCTPPSPSPPPASHGVSGVPPAPFISCGRRPSSSPPC